MSTVNRDDIIRMAREAGIKFNQRMEEMHTPLCDGVHIEDIERFAALVAAAEREACADVVDKVAKQDGLTKEQRLALHVAADAIRARGNT